MIRVSANETTFEHRKEVWSTTGKQSWPMIVVQSSRGGRSAVAAKVENIYVKRT